MGTSILRLIGLLALVSLLVDGEVMAKEDSWCKNTDNGAKDREGDACYQYSAWSCGHYDDDDFDSAHMCCVCGGGKSGSQPTSAPIVAPTAAVQTVVPTTIPTVAPLAAAQIVNKPATSKPKAYVEKAGSEGCDDDAMVSQDECKSAANSLDYKSSNGYEVVNYAHLPPGCFVGHQHTQWTYTYYNSNAGVKNAAFKSICKNV